MAVWAVPPVLVIVAELNTNELSKRHIALAYEMPVPLSLKVVTVPPIDPAVTDLS